MKKSDIKNKKILVVGMARSGLATVEVLCRQGAYVLCQDSKLKEEMDAEIVEKLDSMNVKYLFGEKPEELDLSRLRSCNAHVHRPYMGKFDKKSPLQHGL